MPAESHPPRSYCSLACWLCLPSFLFLLAPLLGLTGESGTGLALLLVLLSVSAGPMFALAALAIAMLGHFTSIHPVGERRMWTVVALAIAANLALGVGGAAARLLH